jgi:hypothetical protein
VAISSTKGPVQVKRGTSAQWAQAEAQGIILLDGELGYDDDLDFFRVGNGVTLWSGLPNLGQHLLDDANALLASATDILQQILNADSADDVRIAALINSSSSVTHAALMPKQNGSQNLAYLFNSTEWKA